MATLRINAPVGELKEYLQEVARQVDNGFTSGLVDRERNWDIDCDADESIEDLA